MKLNTIAAAMRRRWWVVAGVMLITVFGVVWTVTNTPRYEATAILLLASPAITGAAPDEVPEEGEGSALHPAVVVELAESDDTRESLGLATSDVDYTITATENGIIRVETVAEAESRLVATATTLVREIERIVTELDTADPLRTAELSLLSEPRYVRQRTIVEADGTNRTEFYAVGSVLLQIEETLTTLANPYTASDGTLRVIEEVASTEQIIEGIREDVGDGEAGFELVFQQRDAAPVVHVVASATTPESTMSTLDAALDFLDAYLADRQAQAGASESTWIVFQRLALPTEAQIPEGSLRRPIATIIVLGLIAAATLAVLVDSLVTSKVPLRRRPEGIIDADEPGLLADGSKDGMSVVGLDRDGESGNSGNAIPGDDQNQSSIHAAVAWLTATLAEPRTRPDVMADRGAFSKRTIDRAARQLGVISVRNETEKGRPATWSLPAKGDLEHRVSGESVSKDQSASRYENGDEERTGEMDDQVAGDELRDLRRSS